MGGAKWWGLVAAGLLVAVVPAQAQERAGVAIEFVAGHAGYVDDVWDHRLVTGGVVRVPVTSRLAVGPEIVYLHGRRGTHELTVSGTAVFDLVSSAPGRHVTPFLIAGAGIIRQSSLVGGGPGTTGLFPYTSTEGTLSAGIGARIPLARGWYLAPDIRVGWEPETRISLTLGWRR